MSWPLLDAALASRGETYQALAESTGIDPATLSRYRHGVRRPSWRTIERIAAAIDPTDASLAARLAADVGVIPGPVAARLSSDPDAAMRAWDETQEGA